MTVLLGTEGLCVDYGARRVLNGLSLTVESGEIFGLIGLNGAGKTTFIRSVLDLVPVADGAIHLFGRPHHQPAARRNILYLPERYQPAPQLSGWEHLRLAQAWRDGPMNRARASDLAALLDLEPAALDRRVRTWSKGMAQKLGLIAALLAEAPLLILDEPMSGLDPRARVRLKDRLVDARAQGRSVFFSSHVLADVEEICDRIAILHGGRLLHLGPPADFVASHGGDGLERAFLRCLDKAGKTPRA